MPGISPLALFMRNRPILLLCVLVAAICLGTFWFLQSSSPLIKPVPVPVRVGEPPAVSPVPKVPAPATPVEAPAPTKIVPKQPPPPLAVWETQIDQLLRSNIAETETAQLLINMLPTLPVEGKVEAAQHITNLILDPEYGRVLPLVKNPALPKEVLEVLVTDLMNREDAVKLPALLEIAKLPTHPHQEEALSDLQIFLDHDFGKDWNQWNTALKGYLKKQADENAEPPSAPLPKTPRLPR